MISLTTPAPTVRPPSRMANRSSFSIAIGVMSSIDMSTLSPGITISRPPGNRAPPHPPTPQPPVVPGPRLVQELPKHLHPRHHRLARLPDPHDLRLLPHLD